MSGSIDAEMAAVALELIAELGATATWLSAAPSVNLAQGTAAANETSYTVAIVLSAISTGMVGGSTAQVIAADFIMSNDGLAFTPKVGDRVTVSIDGVSSTLKVLTCTPIVGGDVIAWRGHMEY